MSPAASGKPLLQLPKTFWWGTAISAHQSEGNNVHSDSWLCEHVKPTIYREPSGDACDSYHRYEEDIALAASFGFNCHRIGIEWARIEPEPGVFSVAALDHYRRMLECCHKHGLAPIVTFHHFTTPRWFAARGGFEAQDAAAIFTRYVERASKHLGDLISAAVIFNEGNIFRLLQWMPILTGLRRASPPVLAACAKACGSDRFSMMLLGDPDRMEPVILDAHASSYSALKAGPGKYPVGISITLQDDQGVGEGNRELEKRAAVYDQWLNPSIPGDFIGVQTYTRSRVGRDGDLPPPDGAELTDAGYEFWPSALGATVRYAAKVSGKPVYVTENGIGTKDDTRRIAYIDGALASLRSCIEDGVDVRAYIHWSLLDNYEWFAGYTQNFGLVSVDRTTFRRKPKPSAYHLAAIASRNAI